MTTIPQPFFLDVEKSLSGRPWRDRLDARGNALALAMTQRFALPEMLARVVAGRGVALDEVEDFLEPTVRRLLPDPSTLTDMDKAAGRFADAVIAKQTIAIFGDYDVDGATSSALLGWFLRLCGIEPIIHIPDRIFEGYGPTIGAVRSLAARGAGLLVTVDCGTTSQDALSDAFDNGLDVIVVDHHQADAVLPPALAVVNPNRADDVSGLGYVCAAGLVFVFLVAVVRVLRQRNYWNEDRREPDLLSMLHLVALGTVADVVPLRGLNRAFVSRGLIALRRRDHAGQTALMDVARLSGPPEPWHLGFMLGPRINAGGRIGRADLGVRLLMEDDPVEAAAIAAELDRLNRERQVIEAAAVEQAEAEALLALGHDEKGTAVIVSSEGWHPGVVGLVAARLKERFGRPAFAIALEPGGTGTGSGRSIPGVDLGKAVREAVKEGILVKGGGHAMAAGITVPRESLGRFRGWIEDRLRAEVEAARGQDALLIDGAISAAGMTVEFAAMLARAAPYGAGNPEPLLVLPSHSIAFAEVVGEKHVRFRLKGGDGAFVNGIAFRCADRPLGRALLDRRGEVLHFAGTVSVDRWQGAERVQFRLTDIAEADPGPRLIR